MQAKDVVERAAWLLADVTHVRYSQDVLLKFVSDAQRQVTLLRPDATATQAVVQLAPGSLQAIPADGLRLLSVIRSMGQDGQTPGQGLTLVDRGVLNAAVPDWPGAQPDVLTTQYVFDERTPRLFYVFPPVPDDQPVYVELVYSVAPAELNAMDDALAVDDVYGGPLLDFTLHRAFAMDVDSTTSQQRSRELLESFSSTLTAKLSADLMMSPNQRSAQS